MGLRVLITNLELWPPSGTVTYVRDLALELRRQGHTPVLFTSTRGSVADGLRATGIVVSDRLSGLEEPDIIHGHHHAPTLIAVKRWPAIPAIHVCHDHLSPHDRTPLHPRIRRHVGVSRLCLKRLLDEGVSKERVALLPNFVDTERFRPRPPLPRRPRRALVFSNYAHARSHLPAVRAACRQPGLELDVAGDGVGSLIEQPERVLPSYDIVFAKAKAAIEAMAVGSAVILCDYAGVGPMVTSSRFGCLQARNFGFEALRDPLSADPILRQIARYDPDDAARVRDLVREHASLERTVEALVAIYREVLAEDRSGLTSRGIGRWGGWSWRERIFLWLYRGWASIPRKRREQVRRLPGLGRIIVRLRRLG